MILIECWGVQELVSISCTGDSSGLFEKIDLDSNGQVTIVEWKSFLSCVADKLGQTKVIDTLEYLSKQKQKSHESKVEGESIQTAAGVAATEEDRVQASMEIARLTSELDAVRKEHAKEIAQLEAAAASSGSGNEAHVKKLKGLLMRANKHIEANKEQMAQLKKEAEQNKAMIATLTAQSQQASARGLKVTSRTVHEFLSVAGRLWA